MSLLAFFTPSWAQPGTGLPAVARAAMNFTQTDYIPRGLQYEIIPMLPGLFGDYPLENDVAPCSVLLAAFALLGLAYTFLFVKNWSNGYRCWMQLALVVYCACKIIGYGLRLKWSHDLLLINTGVASVVFNLVPVLLLDILSMVFGYRIFTWRHPLTGHSGWMRYFIRHVYFLVLPILVLAVVAQALPYIRFLTPESYHICMRLTKAAAMLNFLYSMCGMALVQLAYVFKPGSIDDRLFRIPKSVPMTDLPTLAQPVWINNVSMLSFPRWPTKEVESASCGGFDMSYSKIYRVIPSKEQPAGGLCRLRDGYVGETEIDYDTPISHSRSPSNSNSANEPTSTSKEISRVEHLEKAPLPTATSVEVSRMQTGQGYMNSAFDGPSIRTAIIIVYVTSIALTINTLMRLICTFQPGTRGGFIPTPVNNTPPTGTTRHINNWLYHNYVEYIFYGGVEIALNIMFIVLRVDLRFYVPQVAKRSK